MEVATLPNIEVPENFPDLVRQDPAKIFNGALEIIFGSQPQWPITTFAVLCLCKAFKYRCTPARLAIIFKNRSIEFPGLFGTEFVWQLRNVKDLFLHLDEQRLWMGGHHVSRWTVADHNREIERLKREVYYRGLGVSELKHRLADTSDDDLAELLHCCLMEKEAS